MSADTLTAHGAAVILVTPQSPSSSNHYTASGFAVPVDNPDEIVVISTTGSAPGAVTGYGLDGSILFSDTLPAQGPSPANYDAVIAADAGGGVVAAWTTVNYQSNVYVPSYEYSEVISDSGQAGPSSQAASDPNGPYDKYPVSVFSSPTGYHLEWVRLNPNFDPSQGYSDNYPFSYQHVTYSVEQQDFRADGTATGDATGTPGTQFIPWASISIGSNTFTISDNQAQLSGQAAITVPGEPAHAMTQVVAAGLADGHGAAVVWADSGTDYVSIYDSVSNSFVLPRVTVDWSGASDLHVVALNDGGFAVSWTKGGAYYGELFDAAGNGGGKLSLTGEFAAINSAGQLYTVGADGNGNEVVQTYTVAAPGGSTGGGSTGGSSGGSGGVDTLTAKGAVVDLPGADSGGAAITYATIDGSDEVAVAYKSVGNYTVTGYDLDGRQIFSNLAADPGHFYSVQDFTLASAGGAGFIVADTIASFDNPTDRAEYTGYYSLYDASGRQISAATIEHADELTAFGAADGAHLEWDAQAFDAQGYPNSYTYTAADVSSGGQLGPTMTGGTGSQPVALVPYANTQVGLAGNLVVIDNTAQLGSRTAVALPGEPAHALTDVAAAGLASGTTAAVVWVDSGTEHLSIYDASGNSFGENLTLDWGGASDTHVVALRDGGFVVSWMKNGAYLGEVFNASGGHGAVISLAGDVAGIDSAGDLYTVGLGSNGHYQVQTYAVTSPGGAAPPTVYTSDANYTAPDGVSTIYLTGSNQTVHANNGGDAIWSTDTRNVLFGGSGDDTFHIGRAGDSLTGGGGADTFAYATIPWGGSTITDFNASQHDVVDLTGMLADQHYAGSDPLADGYLKYDADSSGNAQVWANYNQTDNHSWWLVTTLDGVSTSSLHYSGGLIT